MTILLPRFLWRRDMTMDSNKMIDKKMKIIN